MVAIERAASPVEVKLFDENHRVNATIGIRRDGTMDDQTAMEVKHLFRCRITNRERPIARRTLAMLADLAEKYEPRTIEFVSAYRVQQGESLTSPHRDARAIDLRIRGVRLTEVRDYLLQTLASNPDPKYRTLISAYINPLVPAPPTRDWMDAFPDRHAYRCLPLAIANAHGWQLLLPVAVTVAWNGGMEIDLKKHKRLWEDLYDAYLAHSRRGERRESLATVKRLIEARAKRKARG
jgi:hypothetical protein